MDIQHIIFYFKKQLQVYTERITHKAKFTPLFIMHFLI